MSDEDKLFLKMLHDPALRANLLERLEQLGLLASFQKVEYETTQESAYHNPKQ